MRALWFLATGIALSGCSGHRAPVAACTGPADVAGITYYPACAVDRQARPIGTPPRLGYTPTTTQTCLRAVIDVVVDANGVPIPVTAKLIRTNDNGFASSAMASLSLLRYEPATRQGQPVAQLVRLEPVMVLVRSTGAPPSAAAARSASRSC